MQLFKSFFHSKNKFWVFNPFWLGFIVALLLGLFSHFVLPIFRPELFRSGMITLLKDPFYFHELGIKLMNLPWGEFTFRPEGQLPGGVLGLVYKIFDVPEPFMFLPVLAALAGLTVCAIVSSLGILGVQGRWWPLVFGVLFTITPTSLSWMIYPHKDSFIVPGILLIFYSYIAVIITGVSKKSIFALIFGSILVLSCKTYFAELLLIGSVLSTFVFIVSTKFKKNKLNGLMFFIFCSLFFGIFAYSFRGYTDSGEKSSSVQSSVSPSITPEQPRHIQTREQWVNIPGGELVNKPLRALAFTRERFLFERPHGRTNFLPDTHLKSGLDVLLYTPRAMQLSFFEPLPWKSFEQSLPYEIILKLAQIEMIPIYLSWVFLILAGRNTFSSPVLIALSLAMPFLFAFGFAMPNIGTVNRYRFPFLILVKLAGLAALWNSSRLKWPGRLLMWVDPPKSKRKKAKVLFLVPDDATFIIQRLVMARGAQKAGYDVHVAAEDTGASKKIQELGFTFHKLDLNRGGINPFADFLPFLKLILFLAKERPDILQCVSIKPVLYGATAGTIVGLKRIACLINGRGYAFDGNGFKGKIIKKVAISLYRNALALPGIRVIFQNPDDQQYFVENGLVSEDKTILIRGSGVDMDKFKPSPAPSNQTPVILFVGRLLWNKGLKELVEASKILKKNNTFRLVIVGAPDERNPEAVPRSYLEELHKEGVIDWVGRQSDMPRFYREADIICLPTQYKEGLPLTLLEAASTGRPLIATDVPGCREIVRPSQNGFLVKPKDVDSLKLALEQLINNSDMRILYGQNSVDIVRSEFSAEIIQEQLVRVYETLLNDATPLIDNLNSCLTTS